MHVMEWLIFFVFVLVNYQRAVVKMKTLHNASNVSETDSDRNSEPTKRMRQPKPKRLEDFIEDCSSDEDSIPKPPKLFKVS